MSFTQTALLWALPAALIPLLIHLLSRRQARRLPLSDLALLRAVYARALPRTRLRQWLLVAARCGLLAALILAYAGPLIRGRGGAEGAAGGAGLDLVLALDVSYSMGAVEGGRRRFDAARASAIELLRSLRPGDRAAVLAFSDRVEGTPPAWGSPREAEGALAKAEVGWRGTDYAAALKAAYALPAEPGRRRIVLLLSDGAAHGLRGTPPAPPEGTSVYGLEWPGVPANAGALAAGPAAGSSAAQPKLRARVRTAQPSPVELWLDGRRVQAVTASPREGEAELSLTLPAAAPDKPAAWSGRVALRSDALPADDAAYFSFSHPPRRRVLCVYGNPDFFRAPHAGFFLRELLGGRRASLLDAAADFVELGRLREAKLSDYAAVLLADFREVPSWAAADLERYVRGGGGLWVLPGARAEASFASLDAFLPARVAPAAPLPSAHGLKAEPSAPWRSFDLDRVAVARAHGLQLKAGAQAPFRASSGAPLLAVGRYGAGRVAIWAGALEPSWGNLALKPLFAAWVPGVIALVAPVSAKAETLAAAVGAPLERRWAPEEAAPARVRVRAPDGRVASLWVKDRSVVYEATDLPGLYSMTEDGGSGRVFTYAVNADRSSGEPDLAPPSEPPWPSLRAAALSDEFWVEAAGRDVRPALLLAAAGLLVVEMALALPRAAAAALFLLFLLGAPARALEAAAGDRFFWSQLRLGPTWDPYPGVSGDVLEHLTMVTSVLAAPQPRTLALEDPALFFSPLVLLAGREAPPVLDEAQRRRLRQYLTGGGMLWVEDTSGASSSSFDRWLRRTLAEALPEAELSSVPPEHAVYKSFYLLRGASGRVQVKGSLEGVSWAGRLAVVYSRNDMLGAWAKDAVGRPLLACSPGGEPQRHAARKLTVNVLMYSLTGNYKADAVHQPYLLQKLRSAP